MPPSVPLPCVPGSDLLTPTHQPLSSSPSPPPKHTGDFTTIALSTDPLGPTSFDQISLSITDQISLSITATTQEVSFWQAVAVPAKITLEQRRRHEDYDNKERLQSQHAAAAAALAGDSEMPPQQSTGWQFSYTESESISRSNSEGLHNMETMVWNLLKDERQQQQGAASSSSSNSNTSTTNPHSPSFFSPPGQSDGGYHSPTARSPVAGGSPIAAADPVLVPVPPPSSEALELMARLCLERILGRSDSMARRTELGIALRDALGPAYQKGWVNAALAELELKGHGRLTPDGVFFRASSPLLGAVANMRLRSEGPMVAAAGINTTTGSNSSSSSSRPGKRGFLLIDGGYYEWLQWHVLQGRAATHAIDVRLLVQRLEKRLGVSFVRRLYVQSTETGARGTFHKMLEASAGFEVELHRLRDSPSSPPYRGVGVAITAQVMSSTFKAAFDALVVLTGGASDLAPAFRMAQAENESRYRSRQRVQEVVALGGTRTSPELFPYLYRPADGSAFIFESLMAACLVPKSELGRGGGNLSISSSSYFSPQRNARSLSPPMARLGLPESGFESSFPPPPPFEAPSKGRSVSYSSFQQRDHRNLAAHELGSLAGSPLRTVATGDLNLNISLSNSNTNCSGSGSGSCSGNSSGGGGAGAVGGGRPRRWCNFGHRCKYFEDVEANAMHFQRFAHVCQHDLQCPFVLNYAAHRSTEEGKAHFAMWKHSCPHGLDCQYFAQPDKHRRHIEFFTHKAKVLNAAAAAVAHQQQHQQQQQQMYQHQHHELQHHDLAALSLSPPLPSASPLPALAARVPLPLPATLNETEQLLSRFVGDWDPEVVSQMLQKHHHQQSKHHHQQLQQLPRPPGLQTQHSSSSTHSSSSGPLTYSMLASSVSGVNDEVSSQSSAGAASNPSWSPRSSTSTFW